MPTLPAYPTLFVLLVFGAALIVTAFVVHESSLKTRVKTRWMKGIFAATLAAWVVLACTPEQRREAKTVIDLADNACVLIPLVTHDGTASSVCATLDDLMPRADEILAAQKRRLADGGTDATGDHD